MNTVQCPNCGFQNQAGLAFCTNCGNQISAPSAPPSASQSYPSSASAPPVSQQFGAPTQQQPFPQPTPAKSSTGKYLAIFGGIGCLVLLLGGGGIIGLIYYAGSRAKTNYNYNYNSSNYNGMSANNRGINSSANNAVNRSDSNINSGSNANSNSSVDPTFSRMMPANLGAFKLQNTSVGEPSKDFPGANKIAKATYTKGSKKVNLILAEFSSAAEAKSRYGYFLNGFKNVGAKILNQQKVKNKAGQETGEAAIYSYSSVYEGMFYNESYGSRITAPDLSTLSEFATAFGNYFG